MIFGHPSVAGRGHGGKDREDIWIKGLEEFRGFLVNACHHGATWHATLASSVHVARLGYGMDHITWFRDSNKRFESLGI